MADVVNEPVENEPVENEPVTREEFAAFKNLTQHYYSELATYVAEMNARLSMVVPATKLDSTPPRYEQGTVRPHRNTPGEV